MARFKVQLSSGGLGGPFYMGELDPSTANQNRAFQMGGLVQFHWGQIVLEGISTPRPARNFHFRAKKEFLPQAQQGICSRTFHWAEILPT